MDDFFRQTLGVATPPHRGVDTSRAAAEKLTPKWAGLKLLCLQEVAAAGRVNVDRITGVSVGGMTADEVAAALRVSILSVRPAITTLGNAGVIKDSGVRRQNSRNNSTIVWIKTSTG